MFAVDVLEFIELGSQSVPVMVPSGDELSSSEILLPASGFKFALSTQTSVYVRWTAIIIILILEALYNNLHTTRDAHNTDTNLSILCIDLYDKTY